MAKKSNLFPTIEQTVTIVGVAVGDKASIKFNGIDLTPKTAALLTSWYMGKVKIKMLLQPIESVMFTGDDIPDEPHPMEKPKTGDAKKSETDKQ